MHPHDPISLTTMSGLDRSYWADPTATAGIMKRRVMLACMDVLHEFRVGWEDILSGSHCTEVRAARERICAIIYAVLSPWMNETDMAEWIGIPRTSFGICRTRFFGGFNDELAT